MSRPCPFAPLGRIGDGVYLYEPPSPPGADYNGPSLIVMSTWLGGASAKNIGHYVTGHRTMFPGAAILLVTARLAEITVTPFATMHARLQPARDTILKYILQYHQEQRECPASSVLWHIFSNGGLNMAIQLARITRQKLAVDGSPSQSTSVFDESMAGIIMDCCPGDSSLNKTYKAAAYSLPNTWTSQTIGPLLLYPTIATLLVVQNSGILGKGGSLGDLYKGAHDPAVFGWRVPRLYLYSVSDRLVPWRFVNRHMDEAREKGIPVNSENIPGGGHCALLRGDATRYWRAVERFWRNTEAKSGAAPGEGHRTVGVSENKRLVDEVKDLPTTIALLRSRL